MHLTIVLPGDSPRRCSINSHLTGTHKSYYVHLMMARDLIGFDLFTLKGDALDRAKAALRVARNQVRLAYDETPSWRLEAVLCDIEDQIDVHLSQIETALDADTADLEAGGEAAARRQAELPLRAA